MVDLAAAYQRMDEMLVKHGHGDKSYLVRVDLWNHRRSNGSAEVTFSLSAHIPGVGQYGVLGVDRPTLEEALAAMDEALVPYAISYVETDVPDAFHEVRLPGEVVDAEMPPLTPLTEDDEPF